MFVRLFGAPAVRLDGDWVEPPPGLATALLCYLAVCEGWVSREELGALLWPDVADSNARTNLRQLLSRTVRGLPYAAGLEIESRRLRWPVDSDVTRFRRALAEGAWQQAVLLHEAPLLGGFPSYDLPGFDAWLEGEREALRAAWQEATLTLVAERRSEGRTAEVAELLARLHHADPLDEEVLRSYLGSLHASGQQRRALETFEAFREALREEFGGEPEAETTRLVEQLRTDEGGGAVVAVAVRPEVAPVAAPARDHLPVPPTPLVGRREELAEIASRLGDPDCRLLTLVAPGGMGKSRLAIAAAEASVGVFRDGVHFVPLVAVSDPEQVVYAIGEILELRFAAGDPWLQLRDYLRDRELLLVLDNLEHLLVGVSRFSELLEGAPGVKLVATSRERLRLRSEWVLELQGLGYPGRDDAKGPSGEEAIELFLQLARRNGAEFALGEPGSPHVARITRLVEGMPLAIELAASWLRVLSPREIAEEIERGIDLLEAGTRDLPDRHRSVRAVFDASWKLLSERERRALQNLSVFYGGFRREAAAEVAGAPLPLLASLVDKSFLRVTPSRRYRRHPLVRQYVLEKLGEGPELAGLRSRHAGYYGRWLAGLEQEIRFGRSREAMEALAEELANIVLAWNWALEQRNIEVLQTISVPLGSYYTQRGRFREGVEVFEQAVAALAPEDPAHREILGRVLVELAWLHFREGNNREAAACADRGLELLRPLGASHALMEGLNAVGSTAGRAGRYQEAKAAFQEALDLATGMGDDNFRGRYLNNLAITEKELGDYGRAERHYREALTINRRLDNRTAVVRALNNLGQLLVALGKPGEAMPLLEEGLELARAMEFRQTLPHLLGSIGSAAEALGKLAEAEAAYGEALQRARRMGARETGALALRNLGRVAVLAGDPARGEGLLREALRVGWEIRGTRVVLDVLLEFGCLRAGQGRPELAAALLTLVRNHPATDRYAQERAGQVLATCLQELTPEEVARAEAHGAVLELGEVVTELLAGSTATA